MNHTPGPWKLEAGRVFITPGGEFYITYGNDRYGNPNWKSGFSELDANARLIAAAPELLDWLKKAEQMAEQQFRGDSDIPLTRAWSWLSENCQKVIAKAEGR